MTKQIVISDIEEDQEEIALEEVLRLIRTGCTSGINPTWDITEEKEKELVSSCCSANTHNPSGEDDGSAICMDCKEHCDEVNTE